MSVLRLVPVIGDDVLLDQDRALVGREPTCDVVIEHGSVSRKHAVLERRDDGWYVVDQGSANGTYIDSAKVGESALHHGQELRFGAAAYRVDLPDEDEAGATVITPMPETDGDRAHAGRRRAPARSGPSGRTSAAPPALPPPIPPRAAAPPPRARRPRPAGRSHLRRCRARRDRCRRWPRLRPGRARARVPCSGSPPAAAAAW